MSRATFHPFYLRQSTLNSTRLFFIFVSIAIVKTRYFLQPSTQTALTHFLSSSQVFIFFLCLAFVKNCFAWIIRRRFGDYFFSFYMSVVVAALYFILLFFCICNFVLFAAFRCTFVSGKPSLATDKLHLSTKSARSHTHPDIFNNKNITRCYIFPFTAAKTYLIFFGVQKGAKHCA